jgi:DNA invertase Pin-like site-specific DNA recombinase
MKAIIYLRVSTEEQEPEHQRLECLEFAKNRGYDVQEVLLEKLSGFKQIIRPEYEKVKEKARKGEIQAVIVWALDRWVRNRDTLLEDVTTLRNYGCKIHSVKEAWLEAINIEGSLGRTIQEFLLGIMGSIAEMESQRKSERVKIAYKNHKGKKWGRPSIHTNKKKLVWELRDKGESIRSISRQLNLSIGKVFQVCSEKEAQNNPIKTP